MNIHMGLSHLFTPEAPTLSNARVLKALLDALIIADEEYLRTHKAPRLYASRIVYGRTNEWESIPDMLKRGYGDCKSLSAWYIAEKRVKDGETAEPQFRWKRRAGSGIPDFHILVLTKKGFEDPSKVLGMNLNENAYMGGGR